MYLTKTVHERLAVAEPATLAVFGPKQFLRHAVPKQLLADVLEVYRVARLCRFPVGEERLLDCRVVHAFGMRPVILAAVAASTTRFTVLRDTPAVLAMFLSLKP